MDEATGADLARAIAQEEGVKISSGGDLRQGERFWRSLQPWLKERGYILRPRYHPEWKPSWEGTKKHWKSYEDGQRIPEANVIDATREADGTYVVLKLLNTSSHPFETEIGQFFSSVDLRGDPLNHCVPILDILQVPSGDEEAVVVMPMLRKYNDPRFETIGEAVDFFQQIFEGLHFMHKHGVAHRDCNSNNIMMDPIGMYPNSYHPIKIQKNRDFVGDAKYFTRTQMPPKYYFVDFGLSRKYEPGSTRLEPVLRGGDKTAPEHQDMKACDPFPTDVYYIGNVIRQDFIKRKRGFDFIAPLVDQMVANDPTIRPTMDRVVASFDGIKKSLGPRVLGARVADRNEFFPFNVIRDMLHLGRHVLSGGRRMRPTDGVKTS